MSEPSPVSGPSPLSEPSRIDRRALGRALTRLANATVAEVLAMDAQRVARGAAPVRDAPLVPRIGVTGAPGAGKSSLAGRLALVRAAARAVGMLAIDPSSPRTGGAILGDRIRMDELQGVESLYIRSLASRTAADGLAQNLPELLHAMEQAGFDELVLETVGVGQVEHAVRHQVDTVVLVLNPETGDIVQAMKAGIMELADVYVVHKADLPGAARVVGDVTRTLQLAQREGGWRPPVLMTSINDAGSIAALSSAIDEHQRWLHGTRSAEALRIERARYRLRSLLERSVAEQVAQLPAHAFDAPLAEQLRSTTGRLAATYPTHDTEERR